MNPRLFLYTQLGVGLQDCLEKVAYSKCFGQGLTVRIPVSWLDDGFLSSLTSDPWAIRISANLTGIRLALNDGDSLR